MTEDVSPETVVMQALSDSGPAIPPAPIIRTHSSLPYLIIGNTTLLLLIAVGWQAWLSWWFVIAIGIVLFFLKFIVLSDNEEILKNRFRAPRYDEIRSYFDNDSDAGRQVEKDLASALDLLPFSPWAAIPTLVLALIVPVDIFLRVYHALDFWWLLNGLIATLAALGGWLVIFLLWLLANATPALREIDYLEVRREEAEAQKLGPEDQNDIQIISQIANLESLNRRIDTYTLESALLSALSFSSFMSITLSENNYVDDLHRLLNGPFPDMIPMNQAQLLDMANFAGPSPMMAFVLSNMIALIGLCLLLCATTFLGVLVARLRFNDGYRDAESLLRVAERLNEKEDQALAADEHEKARIYADAISTMLDKARKLENGLGVTVLHMRISRDMGILFFIAALVLCGLFFGGAVSILVSAIFLGALIVGYFDRFTRGVLRKEIFSQGILGALSKPFRRPADAPPPK